MFHKLRQKMPIIRRRESSKHYSGLYITCSGKYNYNCVGYRIWIANGVRDGNSHRICGPGLPGTPQKAEFVDSEQNPRTGCHYYFIKKTFFEEISFNPIKTTTPRAQNDRKDRGKISSFYTKSGFVMVFASQTSVFHGQRHCWFPV